MHFFYRHFDDEDARMNYQVENENEEELNRSISSLNTNDQVPLKKNRVIDGLPENRGSVLIFVPGMHNIQTLNDLISREFPPDYKIDVIPLHSEIPTSQQQRVFVKPQCNSFFLLNFSCDR